MEAQTPLSFGRGALSVPPLTKASATLRGRDICDSPCEEVAADESTSSFRLDPRGFNSKLFHTETGDAEHYRKSFITQTKASLQIQFPVLCMCNSLV